MFKNIISFFIILFSICRLYADHLMGAEITYKCLGNTQYEITLSVYRDCNVPTPFDQTIYLGIYQGTSLANLSNFEVQRFGVEKINNTISNPCIDPNSLPSLCRERDIYKKVVSLPMNAEGYYVTWGRCCRSAAVNNVFKPDEMGIGVYTFIPGNVTVCNNSPTFNQFTPTFICLYDYLTFDQSATDIDGDSLYYAITPPFNAGSINDPFLFMGPQPNHPFPLTPNPLFDILDIVSWNQGYSNTQPINSSPALVIDGHTGELKVRPMAVGQYIISISVYEFRAGKLLSEVKRDIQINVINCPVNFPPNVEVQANNQVKNDTLLFYMNAENCFNFKATDLNGIGVLPDSLKINITGDALSGNIFNPPFATTNINSGYSPQKAQLCWTPSCNQSQLIGNLYITVTDQNDCPGPNVVTDTFVIKLLTKPTPPIDLRCVSVEGNNTVRLDWVNPPDSFLLGFKFYRIERKDNNNNWQVLAQINDSTLSTFVDNTATNANTISYSYRLSIARTCPTFFVEQPSNEVSTMIVNAISLNEAQIQVNWTLYKTLNFPVNYTVIAQDTPNISEFVVGQNIEDTFFVHNACQFLGSYRIKVTDPLTGCIAYSGRSNELGADNQPVQPSDICLVSVDSLAQGNLIKWYPFNGNDFGKYQIYRKRSDEASFGFLTEISNLSTLSFLDQTADIHNFSYCYLVKMIDVCGLEYNTESDCSILLTTSQIGMNIILSWTPYLGWGNQAFTYQIFDSYDEQNVKLIANNISSDTTTYEIADFDGIRTTYCYKIIAVKNAGTDCSESQSNTSCQVFEPTLFSPTAFSPNGDGINDEFSMLGYFHQSYQMTIYDRWGKVVFTSHSAQTAWDGKSNGKDVPEGIYTYFVKAIGAKGEILQRNGTVTLIR